MLKLSEAMEAGWKALPQVRNHYYAFDGAGLLGACAIGAACYAVDPEGYIHEDDEAVRLFPQLEDQVERNDDTLPLMNHIFAMNDTERASEQEIISFVRQAGY